MKDDWIAKRDEIEAAGVKALDPPGIQPRTMWEALRVDNILCAMERYAKAEKAVPVEWVEELRGLVG